MTIDPPESVAEGGYLVRRLQPYDGDALGHAIDASRAELRAPWASPEGAQRLRSAPDRWDGQMYRYGVFRGPQLVGGASLIRTAPDAMEVGYWTHHAHVGKGVATAAAKALIKAGFAVEGVRRLEAVVVRSNTASLAVLGKCGFTPTTRAVTSEVILLELAR